MDEQLAISIKKKSKKEKSQKNLFKLDKKEIRNVVKIRIRDPV